MILTYELFSPPLYIKNPAFYKIKKKKKKKKKVGTKPIALDKVYSRKINKTAIDMYMEMVRMAIIEKKLNSNAYSQKSITTDQRVQSPLRALYLWSYANLNYA